jgi:P pilus assembly chaperone PapD
MLPAASGGALRRAVRAARWTAALAIGAARAAPLAAQISVNRMEVFLQPAPGDRRVGVIKLTNDGDKPVQAQIRLEDWERSEDGTNAWYPQGSRPGSCGKRLDLFPASVALDPGASQSVRVTLDSSAVVSSECWAGAVVETVQPRTAGGRAVNYLVRTAVKVYVTPPALTAGGEVAAFSLIRARGPGADSLDLVFANTGGRHLVTKGTVEFRRPDNSVAATVEVPMLYTLPGAKSRTRLAVPTLPAGRYVALALLDFGGDELTAAEVEYARP